MYFIQKKVVKFNESNIFQVSEIFSGKAAFDTYTFQRAILYQNEGHLILCPVI